MPPLAYCTERDIAPYATVCAFPLIPCTLMTDGGTPAVVRASLSPWARHMSCRPVGDRSAERAATDGRPHWALRGVGLRSAKTAHHIGRIGDRQQGGTEKSEPDARRR
jgi:hypothetical protein